MIAAIRADASRWLLPLLLIILGLFSRAAHGATIYSLVVGVNRALDSSTAVLRYADDDALLFHRLLSTAGPSILLVELDHETKKIYENTRVNARRPFRAELLSAIKQLLFAVRMARERGEDAHFFFIYSGHGDVKNNEGYLALSDGKFTARDLEQYILAVSQATTNHIVVDACQSYFLVQAKRVGGQRQRVKQPFYRSTDLTRRFPNTGFLLSTSTGSSSHEWGEIQAGIFSHEVRSGIIGAADLNGDRLISYNEIAAFIHTANESIPNARFRPQIFMKAPYHDGLQPLFHINSSQVYRLLIPPKRAGRYFLEDSKGVRYADMNTDLHTNISLWLPRGGRYYLHDLKRAVEYYVETSHHAGPLVALAPRPLRYQNKGAAHEAFMRIFAIPFSRDAYSSAIQHYNHLARRQYQPMAEEEKTREEPFAPQRLQLTYGLRRGYLDQSGLLHGVRLGYAYRFDAMRIEATLGYSHGAYQRQDGIQISLNDLLATAFIDYFLFQGTRITVPLGIGAGTGWGWQRALVQQEEELASQPILFHYGARAGIEVKLRGPLQVVFDGHLGQLLVEKAGSIEAPLAAGLNIGLALDL
jgi:hypothetical protein